MVSTPGFEPKQPTVMGGKSSHHCAIPANYAGAFIQSCRVFCAEFEARAKTWKEGEGMRGRRTES